MTAILRASPLSDRQLSDRQLSDRRRIPAALVCSILAHLAAVGAVLWVAYARPDDVASPQTAREERQRIVWIAMPGPGGGGGGSKAATPTVPKPVPPPPARAVAQPAPTPVPTETAVAEPEPAVLQPAAAPIASVAVAGAATALPPAPGTGRGDGSGDGDGAGAGAGRDQGFGGGAYRPGNGVTSPVPVTRASPTYTAQAMRARAQGIITLECVVEPNGECGDVRIVRAFAPPFGLDEQAIEAARRWRFRPGMRGGEPVPVLVNLEIEFNIR